MTEQDIKEIKNLLAQLVAATMTPAKVMVSGSAKVTDGTSIKLQPGYIYDIDCTVIWASATSKDSYLFVNTINDSGQSQPLQQPINSTMDNFKLKGVQIDTIQFNNTSGNPNFTLYVSFVGYTMPKAPAIEVWKF